MNLHHPIRVVARVRPSSTDDDEACMQVAPAASQIVLGFDNFYDFDAVFGDDISQHDFYTTCLTDMIASFFNGYNNTVISYGQQGSGKTYTMNGPQFVRTMNEEEFGLLPRAVRDIFKMMNQVPNREYRVHISYLIIHQESVYDLLSNGLVSLNVLEDNGGNVVMPGLTVVDCHSISDVLNCLEEGLLLRHSAFNQGFDLTSAHTMFHLALEHQWTEPNGKINYIYSRLNFVDLAGSEENVHFACNDLSGFSNSVKSNFIFNSDLKALTNVICSLTNKNLSQMVPYRASRLTHLLKDALGGNSLTLMVCCLSPSTNDFEASFNTMKLGCLTRYVINVPCLNVVSQSSSIPSVTPSNNRALNSYSSTHTGNSSIALKEVPGQYLNMTTLGQLNQGLPPNLQVVQASLVPMETTFNHLSEEFKPQRNDDIFKDRFAASQWHLLVSSAEELLSEILRSGVVSSSEKTRIESWLCMKAETDECIGPELRPTQIQPESNRLEVIEELSEPSILNDSISSTRSELDEDSEVSSSVSSLGENFCDQLEQIREKFLSMTSDLIREAEKKHDVCEVVAGNISDTQEKRTEIVREKIENMNVSVDTTEEQVMAQKNQLFLSQKDKDNFSDVNFGSNLSLISVGDEHLSSPTPALKRTTNKTRRKMVEKFHGFSLRVKNASTGTPVDTISSSDFVSADDDDSSGNELLRKVSSKLVSVSKGSSKCVNSLKTKSFQLKRSIRSHIFKKRPKNTQGVLFGVENPKFSHSSDTKPCSVRIVSDDLRVAQQRLKILSETIKAKEELVAALRQTEPEAETMRKTCLAKIEKCEIELNDVKEQYQKAQYGQDSSNEKKDKRNRFRNEMEEIQKKLSSLQNVSSISTQDDAKVKELQENIRELIEEQEELQTTLREELQRKQLLEQQILREDRCARNPLASSKLLDDESEDCDMEDSKAPPPQLEVQSCYSKKRKLVNSTGDSQSETHSSWRGRDRHKAGRLDTGSDHEIAFTLEDPENLNRRHINILRTAKEGLIVKRQRMDKKIRKGRVQNDGRIEERKLLELDEALEGLDAIIELKNLIVCGNLTHFEPFSPLLAKIDLEETFRELPLDEVHFILIKYFDRLIDLRIEFRQQELDYAELENQYDEQNRYISNLKAAYQQASLEMERRLASLQREYQYKISYLLRQFNEDSSGVNEMKVLEMEQQVYYYKKLSRELKEKLKEYLNQGQSRVIDPGPGPSGIRSRSYQNNSTAGVSGAHSSSAPWSRRERRHAVHAMANILTKVTREKNKLIIQQGED